MSSQYTSINHTIRDRNSSLCSAIFKAVRGFRDPEVEKCVMELQREHSCLDMLGVGNDA